MDLPILLEKQEFISGKQEIEQQFILILKSEYGDFISDWMNGSAVTPHISNLVSLDIRLRAAIKRMKAVKLRSLEYSGDTIKINYSSAFGVDTFFYENI